MRCSSRRKNSIGVVICTRGLGRYRYIERECFGRFRSRRIRPYNSRGIFGRLEEEIWWRR